MFRLCNTGSCDGEGAEFARGRKPGPNLGFKLPSTVEARDHDGERGAYNGIQGQSPWSGVRGELKVFQSFSFSTSNESVKI